MDTDWKLSKSGTTWWKRHCGYSLMAIERDEYNEDGTPIEGYAIWSAWQDNVNHSTWQESDGLDEAMEDAEEWAEAAVKAAQDYNNSTLGRIMERQV